MYRFLTAFFFFFLITLNNCDSIKASFEEDLTNHKFKIWKEYGINDSKFVFNGLVAFDYENKEWHECEINHLNREMLNSFEFHDVEWTDKSYRIKEKDGKVTLSYKTYNLEVSKIQNDTIHFKKNGEDYLFVHYKDEVKYNNCW